MSGVYKDKNTDEWFFPQNEYLMSETDKNGKIIFVNDLFCEISGFTREELIGQPHNIVRHPEMPKQAFFGLWNDVQTKGFWTGYVKNLRKGGGFYWVYAQVLRKFTANGDPTYLSIRDVPNRNELAIVEEEYMKLIEKR